MIDTTTNIATQHPQTEHSPALQQLGAGSGFLCACLPLIGFGAP